MSASNPPPQAPPTPASAAERRLASIVISGFYLEAMECVDHIENGGHIDDFVDDFLRDPYVSTRGVELKNLIDLSDYIARHAGPLFRTNSTDAELIVARRALHNALVASHKASYNLGVAQKEFCKVSERMMRQVITVNQLQPWPRQNSTA